MRDIRDEHLMEDYAKTGNCEAFNELYRRYKAELRGFLNKYMFGDHADDVSQVVWSNVHEYREQFDPDYRFKDWLFRMAAKKAHQWMAKRRPDVNIDELKGFDPVDPSSTNSEEEMRADGDERVKGTHLGGEFGPTW